MKNQNLKKATSAEMQQLLSSFQMMDLVAQFPSDFDPRDHLNKTDANYGRLMSFYDDQFNYEAFLKEMIAEIGSGFQTVLIGYETLVELFCEADQVFLQEKSNIEFLQGNEVKIKAVLTHQSADQIEFNRKVMQLLPTYGHGHRFIHVDRNGFETTGFELKNLTGPEAFPVSTYVFIKPAPIPVPYQSPTNN